MEQKIKMFIVGGCLICLICCVKVLNTMNDKLAYIKEKAEYIEEQGRANISGSNMIHIGYMILFCWI